MKHLSIIIKQRHTRLGKISRSVKRETTPCMDASVASLDNAMTDLEILEHFKLLRSLNGFEDHDCTMSTHGYCRICDSRFDDNDAYESYKESH